MVVSRARLAVGGEPIFFKEGSGPYLTDIDGETYLDYIGSWGPMILGHRHPRVVKAIEEALSRGTSYGAPTEAESGLAEQIIAAVTKYRKGSNGEFGYRGCYECSETCAWSY